MSLVFNPAPGWPEPPADWVPEADWQPDPEWPPAPEGWQLWIEQPAAASTPQAPSTLPRWGLRKFAQSMAAELETLRAANAELTLVSTEYSTLQATLDAAHVTDTVDAVQKLEAHAADIRLGIAAAEAAARQNIVAIDAEAEQHRAALAAVEAQSAERRTQIALEEQALQAELRTLTATVVNLRDTAVLQDAGLFDFEHAAENSLELKDKLDTLRAKIKAEVRSKDAISFDPSSFTFNNSPAQGAKFVKEFATLMLRAYNSEAENCVKSVRAGNLTAAEARLDRARDTISKLGLRMNINVGSRYHRMRMDELGLAARYLVALAAKKEAEREERARLREEEKVLREIEAARAKLDKERAQYVKALEQLLQQPGADTTELEQRLAQIDLDIENVEFRGRTPEPATSTSSATSAHSANAWSRSE